MAKNSKEKQKEYDEKRKGRTRNFATVVYPDSAPDDWIDKLISSHVACLISPLHDSDFNPSGELKKPHYHVLVMYDSVKNFETQVKPFFDEIGGVGREMVNSSRGYARYLCHLDNPEKAQYNPEAVKCFGGADYHAITQLPTDDLKMLRDIFKFIRKNEICSLSDFLDVCLMFKPEWFNMVVTSRGYIVDKYIKSVEWERSSGYVRKHVVNPDTGEIMDSV